MYVVVVVVYVVVTFITKQTLRETRQNAPNAQVVVDAARRKFHFIPPRGCRPVLVCNRCSAAWTYIYVPAGNAVRSRLTGATDRITMVDDARVEALRDELRTLDLHEAAKAIRAWLGEHSLQHGCSRPTTDSLEAIVVSPPQQAPPGTEPPNAAPLTAPPAAAGQPASSNRSHMPRRLYDTEPVSSRQLPPELLMKPDPVFHGERDDRRREMAPVYEFPMHVRLLTRTYPQPRSHCSHRTWATGAGDLRPSHVGSRV